jgi:hypothetical protein
MNTTFQFARHALFVSLPNTTPSVCYNPLSAPALHGVGSYLRLRRKYM